MPHIAEVTLAYKSPVPVETLPKITSPDEAAAYLRSIWDDDLLELKEQFIVVLLNNAKQVLGWNLISSGGSTATVVDIAAIFQVSILGRANSIVISHNHPTNCKTPSTADIHLTKRVVEAGKLLGIPVDDHIILYRSGYTSFRNRGLM